MSELKVRGLPQSLIDALKARADRNQRSMESELRILITEATSNPCPVCHAPKAMGTRRAPTRMNNGGDIT